MNIEYPQFTRNYMVRRHKTCVLLRCCVAFAPCTPGTCRSSALHDADFMPSDSGDLKEKEFLHFQGRRRKRYL